MKGWYYIGKDGPCGPFKSQDLASSALAQDVAMAGDEPTMVHVSEDAKFAKAQVGYSPGKGNTKCQYCTHYLGHACELVEGSIDPNYWCRKFEAKTQAKDAGGDPALWHVRDEKNQLRGVLRRQGSNWQFDNGKGLTRTFDDFEKAWMYAQRVTHARTLSLTHDNKAEDMKLVTDKPVSEAQRRAMWAAKSGHSNIGIPQSVGKEFAEKDTGGKLPEKKGNDVGPEQIKCPKCNGRGFYRRRISRDVVDMFTCPLCKGTGKVSVETAKQYEKQKQGKDTEPMNAAGMMYVAPDGDILMLRRSKAGDMAGHWGFPGGKASEDETPEQTARRECKEELGEDAPEGDCRLFDSRVSDSGVNFHTFAQPVDEKFVPTLDDEHTGYCWAPLNQLPAPLHPGVADTLRAKLPTDKAAKDMTPQDWQGLTSGLMKFLSEEAQEEEHAEDASLKPATAISYKDLGGNEDELATPNDMSPFVNPYKMKAFA